MRAVGKELLQMHCFKVACKDVSVPMPRFRINTGLLTRSPQRYCKRISMFGQTLHVAFSTVLFRKLWMAKTIICPVNLRVVLNFTDSYSCESHWDGEENHDIVA